MKLTAKQVNTLKANIEGSCLESLYSRLKWDTPKTIRLNIIEKDVIEGMIDSAQNNSEEIKLFKMIIKDRLK